MLKKSSSGKISKFLKLAHNENIDQITCFMYKRLHRKLNIFKRIKACITPIFKKGDPKLKTNYTYKSSTSPF